MYMFAPNFFISHVARFGLRLDHIVLYKWYHSICRSQSIKPEWRQPDRQTKPDKH